MLADPTWHVPRHALRDEVVWIDRPPGGILDELGFGDGSVFGGATRRAARGGWGLSVTNPLFQETARLCGPVPGWHQDITLAELWVSWAYVAHVGPTGDTFYTDCLSLVKAWQRGQAYCSDVLSIYSAVWRRIRVKVIDIGEDNISVVWVPAHLTDAKTRVQHHP